jgi:hypothetical protein
MLDQGTDVLAVAKQMHALNFEEQGQLYKRFSEGFVFLQHVATHSQPSTCVSKFGFVACDREINYEKGSAAAPKTHDYLGAPVPINKLANM